jgi:integrating conjugative element protein (TIGR03765 family)
MGKNLKRLSSAIVLLGHVLLSSHLFAADTQSASTPWVKTKVIEDRGGQLIDHYLPKNKNTDDQMKERFENRKSTKLINAHFPVVTASMSVGKVTEDDGKEIKYQVVTRPMFIIGYDPVSINWLKSNHALLAEKKAIGLVVNVENTEQMEALQRLVGTDVMMQPTPGDRLSEHLKIKHYPFYIDNQGVLR